VIKFEFEVSDEEGDTLFDLINQEIASCVEGQHAASRYNKETREWFKSRIVYLNALKDKMHNTRVKGT
jgi:hypothetical protein